MIDNEIIKALECCKKAINIRNCDDCPLQLQECIEGLPTLALDLINRQKAEIERLQEECGKQSVLWSKHYESIFESAKEVVRAEALTDFAERLCEDRVSNDPVVIAVKTELKMMEEGVNNA